MKSIFRLQFSVGFTLIAIMVFSAFVMNRHHLFGVPDLTIKKYSEDQVEQCLKDGKRAMIVLRPGSGGWSDEHIKTEKNNLDVYCGRMEVFFLNYDASKKPRPPEVQRIFNTFGEHNQHLIVVLQNDLPKLEKESLPDQQNKN